MKRSGFSMIELVFVIVILGVLAAVAVPRFVTTRTDAQVAMLRSDIASTLKAIPARIFAENIDPTASTPNGYSSWGEWIIDTGGLDRGRWAASAIGGKSGVGPLDTHNGTWCVSSNQPGIIYIDEKGNLNFNPETIGNATGAATSYSSTLCNSLKASYPSGSNRVIPLATTGAVKF
ncbi:type II secretion system protein [Helicobacter sp. MIT 99-5507]|uniref:type II secretion system protein n=1 Tax=Helicobacter sp. MIT 99-5507 TaxID=152489 RepID=UPI000E1E49A8|nr:type II secretion system protein [Helicobacter sp. MIT 99-5507]RDU58128.1 hypothetical protein CQA42_04305 [Helicobacter sp. MIT 99-5507]